jgi:hypothetical protein
MKTFPLQCREFSDPKAVQIPWAHAELAYEEYTFLFGRAQTLERLAERGGFGASEIIKLMADRITRLKKGQP